VLGVTLAIGIPIRRRVRTLTRAAEQVARGEVGVQVPVNGTDELARLSTAFNEMSRQRALSEQLRMQLNSDVAHELRTPLTNLLGWLEAAEDGVANYDATLNARLLGETRQLTGIVADLQTLTVADAGGLHLRDDELDLAALLDAVVDSHSRRAHADGVELTVQAEPDLPLRGDGGRIRQVLDNLVANALDHTPRGGRIALTADAAADVVRISVADTGHGIAADDLPSVFERFWRADPSRTRSSGGTGLGLSIVRKLVEAHGGRIDVASVVGEGTVFTIELPAAAERPAEASS
jgi:two-component system sensor histidine kinase BaeS